MGMTAKGIVFVRPVQDPEDHGILSSGLMPDSVVYYED